MNTIDDLFGMLFETYRDEDEIYKNRSNLIAYHGSPESDIENLEYSYGYAGGLGSGVYLSFSKDVAEKYGHYIYTVQLLFKETDIFELHPEIDSYIGYYDEMDTIVTGEYVEPFSFEISHANGGTPVRYFVGSSHYDVNEDQFVNPIINRKFIEELNNISIEHNGVRYIAAKFINADSIISRIDEDLSNDYDFDNIKIDDYVLFNEINNTNLGEVEYYSLLDRLVELLRTNYSYIQSSNEFEDIFGISISLLDLGSEVASFGYKALHFTGIRGGSTHDEILVFDPAHLKILSVEHA